jgi:multiple sugar transport system ATP-binding protein
VTLAAEGVPAEVVLVEPTGSATHVVLQLGGQRLVSACAERVRLRPNDRVGIVIDPAHVDLFDAGSGQRLDW